MNKRQAAIALTVIFLFVAVLPISLAWALQDSGSEGGFSEAEVRLHTEIALDCVAEYAYTHPGIPINHGVLLTEGGACDPFYTTGGNR